VFEHVVFNAHDRFVPRKRERALVAINPHDLVAVVADEVDLRPNEANWTIRHQLAMRTAKRDALGHSVPSAWLCHSGWAEDSVCAQIVYTNAKR
jgi:hypothetical protein